jgi:hypothetical protein
VVWEERYIAGVLAVVLASPDGGRWHWRTVTSDAEQLGACADQGVRLWRAWALKAGGRVCHFAMQASGRSKSEVGLHCSRGLGPSNLIKWFSKLISKAPLQMYQT